ncbi:MAG: hypothetical protein SGARI_002603 [Bacillariaceae sp.]
MPFNLNLKSIQQSSSCYISISGEGTVLLIPYFELLYYLFSSGCCDNPACTRLCPPGGTDDGVETSLSWSSRLAYRRQDETVPWGGQRMLCEKVNEVESSKTSLRDDMNASRAVVEEKLHHFECSASAPYSLGSNGTSPHWSRIWMMWIQNLKALPF